MPRYLDCLTGVLSHTEACPEDVAAEALRDAVIEWCEETMCFETPLLIDTDGNEPEPPDATALRIHKITDARIQGEQIDVLAKNDPKLNELGHYDRAIVFADPSQPYLVPAPALPVQVELLCVLVPGIESEEFPDLIWQKYRRHLEAGARGMLQAMKGKPWSDPNQAGYELGEFAKQKKRHAALLGLNRVTNAQRLRVQPV